MYDLKMSHFNSCYSRLVMSGATIKNDGAVLVYAEEDGEQVVKLSTGSAGEIFAGWSLVDSFQYDTAVKVETYNILRNLFVTLSHTNLIQGQWRVLDVTDQIDLEATIGSDPSPGEYSVKKVPGIICFNKAQLGHVVNIYYKYNLTLYEVNILLGGVYRRSTSEVDFSLRCDFGVGRGDMYMDQYDITQDYSVGDYVKAGSDGLVTLNGDGPIIGVVIHAPNAENPFLGISFNTDAVWPPFNTNKTNRTKKRKFNRYSAALA